MNNLQTKAYPSLTGFGGINTGTAPFNIKDTEATEMLNISSDLYPALTQPKAAAKVMEGMDSIKYLGLLFDKAVFCIGSKGGTLGIYFYNDGWTAISVTNSIRTLLEGSVFTSTNFSDKKTVIATGGSMIAITASGASYSAAIITKQNADEPLPENVNYVITKTERLLTASAITDVLGASQYQEIRFINADDIQLFYVQTDAGSYSSGFVLYNDLAVYFKKNSTHILYGKNPDSYSLDMLSGSVGCVSSKTIAETNVALMWLASDGVYAYSATTLPYKISDPIKKYIERCRGEAAAASDGRKYYLSLEQTDGSFVLCVYDTEHKQWNIEENAGYKIFLRCENEVYASDGNEIYKLHAADFGGDWHFISKPFDIGGASGKVNLHRFYISIRAKKGAVFELYVSPDIDTDSFINLHRQTFLKAFDGKMPVDVPNSADFNDMNYFRIKLSGSGECSVYALDAELRIKRGTY